MKSSADSSIYCTPSWVIPGTYAENLGFLDSKKEIRCVELLFFFYNDEIKALLDCEWDEILRYAKRFVFTAHLPEPLLPEHAGLVSRLAPHVRHFIIHPEKENPAAEASLINQWVKQYGAVFLAENTNPGLLENLLPHLKIDLKNNIGICMDTGHLLIEGKSPAEFYKRYRGNIGEIHLHSVDREEAAIDGKLPDHRGLCGGEPWLAELLPLLCDYRGVINFEVFSWNEVRRSLDVISSE